MWFESQNCAMMGVQVTAGKRKLETAATAGDSCPAKAGRWEPAGTEDCIARLQAVAVPGDAWRPTTAPISTPTTNLTSALLSGDDFDDDDDFEDELSDDDRGGSADPLRYTGVYSRYNGTEYQHHQQSTGTGTQSHHHTHHQHNHTHHHHHHHQQQQQTPQPQPQQRPGYWQYYSPPAAAAQQTIRCEENGKSYLELGSAPAAARAAASRCCDGRTRWCNVPCYRQRRLAVLNLSMCKLARYRQCSDPSLRRSVLICNTLRHIEREMETEGQQPCAPPPPPEPCYSPFPDCPPPSRPVPVQQQNTEITSSTASYEQSLRELTAASGRATPFPGGGLADTDSGIGDEDSTRTINWGSVLSLTSQTDLEPLNNNELYAELGLAAAAAAAGDSQDWKEPTLHHLHHHQLQPSRPDGEWDSFMHVLVGGS